MNQIATPLVSDPATAANPAVSAGPVTHPVTGPVTGPAAATALIAAAAEQVHSAPRHLRSVPARLKTMTLFDQEIVDATTDQVVTHLLQDGRRSRVAFLNAHCGNVMARDEDYADALRTADLILPDGIGVELAARFCGARLTENLNGTDFTPRLLKAAAAQGLSVYLLGAQPGVAAAAADKFAQLIPGLQIAGTRDGFDGMADEEATIAAINASGAGIVLVALGVPRQDLWLARNAHRLEARITMGIGALFDFYAGRVRRAPPWVRRMRGEWVWRLASEPRRMARRYLVGNATFLARAVTHALRRVEPASVLKRGADLAMAGSALVMLAPLALITVLAIRAESRGPALFRQTRVGLDGRTFTLFKFRSMSTDAEARRAEVLETSDREGLCFKSRSDPRVTRVGRVLRRYSLDELPQLLNVLKGEMSMVGPRPALPEEVAAYPAHARGRLAVRPGLTGLWQVSGRAEIGFDKMIDMDLAYARARSPLLDLVIVLMTFRAVLGGRGAY